MRATLHAQCYLDVARGARLGCAQMEKASRNMSAAEEALRSVPFAEAKPGSEADARPNTSQRPALCSLPLLRPLADA